jgi:hypothetical protein
MGGKAYIELRFEIELKLSLSEVYLDSIVYVAHAKCGKQLRVYHFLRHCERSNLLSVDCKKYKFLRIDKAHSDALSQV